MQAESEDNDHTQQDITEQYQIVKRKAWETRLCMVTINSLLSLPFIVALAFIPISFSIKIM